MAKRSKSSFWQMMNSMKMRFTWEKGMSEFTSKKQENLFSNMSSSFSKVMLYMLAKPSLLLDSWVDSFLNSNKSTFLQQSMC